VASGTSAEGSPCGGPGKHEGDWWPVVVAVGWGRVLWPMRESRLRVAEAGAGDVWGGIWWKRGILTHGPG
jgi:hypothetical protein